MRQIPLLRLAIVINFRTWVMNPSQYRLTALLAFLSFWTQAHAELTHYERLVVASTLVLEAASEGSQGMQAVLNVINNRADGDINRVMGVVCKPKQFTALNSVTNSRNPDYGPIIERATMDPQFSEAYLMVQQLERGELIDITDGADHYYADHGETPYWSTSMHFTRKIGQHNFYRSNANTALLAQAQ